MKTLAIMTGFVLAFFTLTVLTPTHADAQVVAPDLGPLTTSTGAGVGLTTTVGGAVTILLNRSKSKKTLVQRYFDANQPAIQQATTLGGGPSVADLALIFDIPEARHQHFARWFRAERKAVLAYYRTGAIAPLVDDFEAWSTSFDGVSRSGAH